MFFSVWERRRISIGGGVVPSSFYNGFKSFLCSCTLIVLTVCGAVFSAFSEEFSYAPSSFQNLDGGLNTRFLSLDGLSSSIEIYPNTKSQKKVVFLPDPREALHERIAEDLQKICSVYIFPNRNGHKRDIRYLGGVYLNHLKYFRSKFPIYRRRSFKVRSPYVYDFLRINQFLKQNEDSFVFLSNFSFKQLLELDVNRKKIKQVIIISPLARLLEEDLSDFIAGSKILWVDSMRQSSIIQQFQDKYGGKSLLYNRSGRGAPIFFRNSQALSDVTQWILSN